MISVHALHSNLVIVFFVNGLALFAMGLAIILQWRRDSDLPCGKALPAAGAYAFTCSLTEWLDVLALVRTEGLRLDAPLPVADFKLALIVISHLLLVWFALDLVLHTRRNNRLTFWMTLALTLVWGGSVLLASRWIAQTGASQSIVVEDLTHYLLGLPGGLLAALGWYRQRTVFRQLRMPQIGTACLGAAASFTAYALSMGLVVPRAPFFPANVLNYGSFLFAVGVPVQLLRAGLAIGMAYFVLQVMRAYEVEQRRRIDRANEERYQAQQEAMQAQRQREEELRQWNETLEQKVQARTAELARREAESRALYAIAGEISASLHLDGILTSLVERARALLGADLVAVELLDERDNTAYMRAVSGTTTDAFRHIRLDAGQGLAGRVIVGGESVILNEYLQESIVHHVPEVDAVVAAEGLQAHMAARLAVGGKTIGVLLAANRDQRRFTKDNLFLLERLAVAAAIAIENANLYDKAQQLAVLDERERLGREIHDGLAQTLGYLGTAARVGHRHLARGDAVATRLNLEEIEQLAEEAYADAREAILGMRLRALMGLGIAEALREYASRFGEQSGLSLAMSVSQDWPATLPTDVEVHLIRIVQQALSNVRKHAMAKSVTIGLDVEGRDAVVTVEDDGRGFVPVERLKEDAHHFGLRTMHERAAAIGGTLLVQSAPGKGTRVILRLPIAGPGDRPGPADTNANEAEPLIVTREVGLA